jgi:hypothetical protein
VHFLADMNISPQTVTVEQEQEWLPGYQALVDALIADGQIQEARPYLEFMAVKGDPEAIKTLDEMSPDQPGE